jgi:predicted MFS family arabinose efflux permease
MVKYKTMSDDINKENQTKPGKKSPGGIFASVDSSAWLIGSSTFFFWAALYLYVPILSVYAQTKGASLTVVGIIVAAYAIPQLLLRIPLGLWSDYIGRQKPLIIGGIIMVILGAIGLVIAPSPMMIGISRVMTGVGAAVWGMYTIYLVSFYANNKAGQVIAVLNLICSGALVIATLSGGAISNFWGPKYTFAGAALLGIISLIIVLFAKEKRVVRADSISWGDLTGVARQPLLIVVSLMGIFLFFAQFAGTLGFLPVYADKIGASDTELGVLTMLTMGISMIGALAVAPLVKYWGNVWPIVAAALMLGLALVSIPFIHNVQMLFAAQVINGLGQGMLTTQLMALSIYGAGPGQRATSMGFYQAMYSIGMLTGPLFSGIIADHYGLEVVFYLCAGLCLAIAGLAWVPILPKGSK